MDTSISAIDRYWSFLPLMANDAAPCGAARGRQVFQMPVRHAGTGRKLTPELPDMIFDLDMVAGLRRAGGDRRAYVDLLRRFGRGQRSFAVQIKEPLARQDWAVAERVVHGCGLAAERIGAKHLAARARVLEAALHDEPGMPQLKPLVQEVAGLAQGLALQLHAQLTPLPATSRQRRTARPALLFSC